MSVFRICALSQSTWNSKDVSLRQPSRDLQINELNESWFKNVVHDMFETLYSTPSGVGLAAPQVGIQIKLVVIDIKRDAKKPFILINPSYTPLTNDTVVSTESCLSVPGVAGTVKRYSKIMLRYLNINGEIIERESSGFECSVLQHEIDHLSGVLYIDKMSKNDDVVENLGHVNFMAKKSVKKLFGDSKNEE